MRFVLVLALLLAGNLIYSQESIKVTSVQIKPELSPAELFTEHMDSLFSNKAYDSLILYSKAIQNKVEYAELSSLCLAMCYFYIGKSDLSNKYLYEYLDMHAEHEKVANPNSLSIEPLGSNSTMVQCFLYDRVNREKIKHFIINEYRGMHVLKESEGMKIMGYFMTDQYIRGIYLTRVDSCIKNGLDKKSALVLFNHSDSLNLRCVASYFKKYGRIFTKEEVGPAFDWQLLLFAHETNSNIRKEYLKYIEEAVKKGSCGADRIISFIMRSEIIEGKYKEWFSEAFNKRIEELKAEYNVPDYSFNVY